MDGIILNIIQPARIRDRVPLSVGISKDGKHGKGILDLEAIFLNGNKTVLKRERIFRSHPIQTPDGIYNSIYMELGRPLKNMVVFGPLKN